MRPQQAALVGLCWGKGVQGEEAGEQKCLCCGIYLMCIIKGIDQQDLQLSCSSWVREGGPSVPCGHLLSGSGPALSHSPALLEEWAGSSGNCWDTSGTEGPEGRSFVRGVAQQEEEAALVSAPAQQHCSARGSLGLGMSCSGL